MVHYFSMVNLKGAIISIVIGAVVYLLFISKCLIKKADGKVTYINAWPKWFDVEELIYRPLLLGILPAVFGAIFGFFDSLVDRITKLLGKTIYREVVVKDEIKEGDRMTRATGTILNALQRLGNAMRGSDKQGHEDYVHNMAVWKKDFREEEELLKYSFSFGLMLFCVGFCLVFIYLVL